MQNEIILSVNILQFTLFLLYAIYSRKKYRSNILGIMLISMYLLVSITCLHFVNTGILKQTRQLMMWPFLYFFFVFVIQVIPFLKTEIISNKLNMPNIKMAKRIADFYIICSIIYCIQNINKFIVAIQTQNWTSIYYEMRGEDAQYYTGFIGQLAINVVNYLQLPFLIIVMFFFTRQVEYKRIKIALFMPIITTIMSSALMASRSNIILLFISYIAVYLVFRRDFSRTQQKLIYKSFIVMSSVFLVLFMAITFSRFGENNSEWLASYFGESYLTAHNLIGHMLQRSEGTYYWGYFLDIFGYDKIPRICAIDNGFAFTTLIGVRSADFGLIGTIFFYLFFSVCVSHLVNKRVLYLSDLYLILYYFIVIFMGIFYDNANSISLVIVLIVAFILKRLSLLKVK